MIVTETGSSCAAPILMDAEYADARTHTQVMRAVGDLRQDVAMVAGAIDWADVRDLMVDSAQLRDARLEAADPARTPALRLIEDVRELAAGDVEDAIVVGVLGQSALLDAVVSAGLFDEAKAIDGDWERYAIKEIDDPLPGVRHAVVVAGSDARGAVFGVYRISAMIGVSPFLWYDDVPVRHRDVVEVSLAEPVSVESPAVKYRGVFINDEDISVVKWAGRKFPTDHGTPDVNYYRHIFEMLLRLGLNTLWPAMHPCSTSFNIAEDEQGVPINAAEASRYGVVIGTSHCENMMRANTREWAPWFEAHRDEFDLEAVRSAEGDGSRESTVSHEADLSYDFTLNREAVLHYWRDRLERNKGFESILTLGIRGIHDGAFHCAALSKYPGTTELDRKVAMIHDVIDAQRALIDEVYGEGARNRVPQTLIVYKEIADIYNAGLDRVMAQPEYEDVTLMWAEDNYNHLRQVPNAAEAARTGGAGLYYHSSYLGSPRSYLWLNTVQLSLMSVELHRAIDNGMNNQIILNVGDIKPGDLVTEFFSKLVWSPGQWDDGKVREFLRGQGRRDYAMDDAAANEYADAFDEYLRLLGVKRTEFFTTDYHEFDLNVPSGEARAWFNRVTAVSQRFDALAADMDADTAAAFYEQIHYHVLSLKDVADEYFWYWKNLQAGRQGRYAVCDLYARRSQEAARRIEARMYDYNGLHHGKWTGYMSWRSVDYRPVIDEDWGHDIVQLDEYAVLRKPGHGVGAACEGAADAGTGVLRFSEQLPGQTRVIDVFSRESGAVDWSLESPDWLKVSQTQGETSTEMRLTASVDWASVGAVKDTSHTAAVKVFNGVGGRRSGEPVAVFDITLERAADSEAARGAFVETNGVLAVEAGHCTETIGGADGSSWKKVLSNGQHRDTMVALPHIGRSSAGAGAQLVYDVWFREEGEYHGVLSTILTLSEGAEADGTPRSRNVAVSVNSEAPQVLEANRNWIPQADNDLVHADMSNVWVTDLLRGHVELPFTVHAHAGRNRIVIWRVDPSIIVERFAVFTQPDAMTATLLGPEESPLA